MRVAVRRIAPWLVLLCVAGCKLVDDQPKGHLSLLPATPPPNQVTLEIFSAPVPLDDPRLAALWSEVDEQPLPPELRKRLARNGLRAGIVAARVPDALAALLKITDRPISHEERTLVPVDTKPGVLLRVLQPEPGKRHDLVVSPVCDEISLLSCAAGQVTGTTYRKAEGRLALYVEPQADGRVRIELVPELHHGQPRTRTSGSDGMFIRTTEREKQVFAELKIPATLAAGEMLLVTSLDESAGTVGHHFFNRREGDQPLRRLWVFRVAQAGTDRAFADWRTDETNGPAGNQTE